MATQVINLSGEDEVLSKPPSRNGGKLYAEAATATQRTTQSTTSGATSIYSQGTEMSGLNQQLKEAMSQMEANEAKRKVHQAGMDKEQNEFTVKFTEIKKSMGSMLLMITNSDNTVTKIQSQIVSQQSELTKIGGLLQELLEQGKSPRKRSKLKIGANIEEEAGEINEDKDTMPDVEDAAAPISKPRKPARNGDGDFSTLREN